MKDEILPQQRFYGCGATLLTCEKDRQPIVVTAAHCVPRYRLGPITVKLRTPKYVACGKAANLNINGVEHILVSYLKYIRPSMLSTSCITFSA